MKISVITPAFNEEKLIATTLQTIKAAAQSFQQAGWDYELIVCDNNSKDRTAEVARDAGALVVFEPVNQISRARNTGASAATGDWLLFIDADSHPSPELFSDLVREIKSGRCLAGGSILEMNNTSFDMRLGTLGWNWLSRTVKWVAGAFVFCETRAFRQLGGFSQELFISEEIELSKRLKKLARQTGKKIVILSRHPMLTSSRKIHLYSRREYLNLFRKLVLSPKATLQSREACAPWYDGRR